MTEPDAYEHVRQVVDALWQWQDRLELSHYTISHAFVETTDDDSIADTTAQWQYRQAHIKWYLPTAATETDESIERTYVHELVHVALEPMEKFVKGHDDECELAAENITRAIWAGWGSLL